MAARSFVIPLDAAAALRESAAYDGPRITITRDVGSDVWRGIKTTVEALGAEYAPRTSAFDFEPDQDARALVMAALDKGSVMAASASHGFVATPVDLAVDLVDLYAEIRPARGRALTILEPSAGRGAFVRAITDGRDTADWMRITAIEVDTRRVQCIPTLPNITTEARRFEDFHAEALTRAVTFDRVVMNPPFSLPGRPMAWADHLLLAWELLAPGGRLVAVVPASVLSPRRDKRHTAVRELIDGNGGAVDLGPDAFAESGFAVKTAVVWLDRPTVADVDPAQAGVFRGRAAGYDLYPYTGAEAPVEVDRPILTRAAALRMPVQAWRDDWRGVVRTCRYIADCCECGRATWGFDDGQNDPRGVLGEAAEYTIDAAEYGMVGPSMGFCFLCSNTDAETYNRAVTRARARWSAPVVPDVFVSPWESVDAA